MIRQAPDPGWLDFLKVIFGFLILFVLAVLAGIIALGHVEQSTSFGLTYILGGLSTLSGMFAQWAFGKGKTEKSIAPKKAQGDNQGQ